MTKILFILIVLVFSSDLFPQISVSNNQLNFSQVYVGLKDSIPFYLINKNSQSVIVKSVNTVNSSFYLSNNSFTVPASDSLLIFLYFSPKQNVIESGTMTLATDDSSLAVYLNFSGSGAYNDFYQNTTFNLYDTPLKNALASLVANHTSLGYNTARDRMFDTIDKQPGDTIECIYSGIKIKAQNRTQAQNAGFDTEHTWPQGTFSQNEPMRSDLFHLYPTNSSANNTRGNLPFGFVVNNVNWSQGGSKRGSDSSGVTVFEPRDIQKGNTARSVFYFIIRFQNYGSYLGADQEKALRYFTIIDPVDSLESRRNLLIKGYQGKSNPFIDHPELIERIYSFTSNTSFPVTRFLDCFPMTIRFDTTAVNSSSLSSLILTNKGNSALTIDSIRISSSAFSFTPVALVPAFSSVELPLLFSPSVSGLSSGTLNIYSTAGLKQVPLTGFAGQTVNINDVSPELTFSLSQNYPNPFNNSTVINFSLPAPQYVNLSLFDILGNKVLTINESYFTSGTHSVSFSSDQLASGIYIYRLQTENNAMARTLLLLK
ncbi:MAG TPA: endonuclease [Ignavibacteriaceae bacterium]|nr:endonuclease [Ignavibacteriaceae bacterium]